MAGAAMYEERPLNGTLSTWATCLWVRRASDERTTDARVVPDGCLDLLWRGGRLEIAGPDTGHRRVLLEPGELICGVRLRPGAARPLLGEIPATTVRDTQPALDLLWGSRTHHLEDRLAAASDPWQAAGALAEALTARLRTHRPDPLAVAVAEALDRPRPPGISALARDFGYSERQLRRRVLVAAGYGPKTLEQILRFRRSLAAAPGADWSRVAAEQGYADQAHLSRQMRRWSGATPRELAAQAP